MAQNSKFPNFPTFSQQTNKQLPFRYQLNPAPYTNQPSLPSTTIPETMSVSTIKVNFFYNQNNTKSSRDSKNLEQTHLHPIASAHIWAASWVSSAADGQLAP